ncbi:MAG: assimilatory sulfite reductase (NADPH) flavoprotein subunit [Paludibacter sp.]|nr:assimilatory sulfite reductase (NADPH) flavoprotein subunit [Paludibacter sp.]
MINNILTPEQSELLDKLTVSLNQQQITWLAGYFTGLSFGQQSQKIEIIDQTAKEKTENEISTELTILYGSRTGNGEGLARKAEQMAIEKGFNVSLKNMFEYKTRDLQKEKNLLLIVSTHGEGEPPFVAKELYEFIHGKRAPKLESLNYAVLALGDSSYFHFCKTGIDFDNQFEKLGGKRLIQRATCDVDFTATADKWLHDAIPAFGNGISQPVSKPTFTFIGATKKREKKPVSKSNPFFAPVLEKIGLHGQGSDRQTIHLELSTEDNEYLNYEPGDALGIIPVNNAVLVDQVLAITGLDAGEPLLINKKERKLDDALYRSFELSKITVDVIKRYLETYPNEALQAIANDPDKLKNYVEGRDIVDLLTDFPAEIDANKLIRILRPLQPRLYSIASSPKAFPGEIHVAVGVVQYNHAGRDKKGTCSNYLSDLNIENDIVPVFIEANPEFRLPKNDATPIIMVGAGTGIAPYRAFVQHREFAENRGKSWLFFGNRYFETEFLYQTEWQSFLKSGALTKMDIAFSRDTDQKVYVQDKLWKNGQEVFQWIESGAHFYICGDMRNMARGVQDTLLRIVEKYGQLNAEQAREYVDNLAKSKRLQLDVY